MLINGREIAEEMYADLIKRVGELKKNNITPHLAVILAGNDKNSLSYIRQKKLAAEKIGAKLSIIQLAKNTSTQDLLQIIHQLNFNDSVHAIVVQKPLPNQIDVAQIDKAVNSNKDVDAFNPQSKFVLALPLAVIKILQICHSQNNLTMKQFNNLSSDFLSWLKTKSIVILGKGQTAGQPTIDYLQKLGLQPIVIDQHTPNPQALTKSADIIISAVGKENTIRKNNIKPGVILIGVGMDTNEENKLRGDYNVDEIKDIASFYTPTPGGVGPVNVASLMENVITAAEQSQL
ncbi:MAG TPA: bifunctional 5,10-methylenetetrahydrofolate dehydrogenase/5,10-methenyltetrahydrofolate cyclohydrolase [Patescibacteria group bacterium]|nr:bifunctional 5,10-methylenetetrahydrofolate dehydrogenase/5,10-methenyltetrahydrofolate cyclohydrolase [Patescibacteria group bacterium]